MIKQQTGLDEYDEPTTNITSMLTILTDLGIQINMVPGELLQRYGLVLASSSRTCSAKCCVALAWNGVFQRIRT